MRDDSAVLCELRLVFGELKSDFLLFADGPINLDLKKAEKEVYDTENIQDFLLGWELEKFSLGLYLLIVLQREIDCYPVEFFIELHILLEKS